MHKPRPLAEQVIVLTGATSGIGLVTARMASRRGARLVLAARNAESLDRLVEEIEVSGGEAIAVPTDTGDEEAVRELGERAIERFGRIDTWINNAAVSIYGRVTEVGLDEHRRLFETNYWGYLYGCLEAVRRMRHRGGQIISVASVLADRSIPMQGAYCASKHAVKGLHESLRMELRESGVPVEVTLVKPSAVDTPYKDHARNYFPVAPKNPPPVYAPETVARAILHCAEHPKREVTVGFGGEVVSLLGRNFPGLTDWIMNRTMHKLQRTEEPPAARSEHSLFEPRGSTLEERGHYPHYVHETSLYTQARLHPALAAAAVAAGVAAGVRATGRSRAPAALAGLAIVTGLWMFSVSRRHGREQPSLKDKVRQARAGYF